MRRAHVLAAALCAIAVALAAGWAIALPMFLSPDEDSHYDYALTLYTAGRPARYDENVVGRDTHPVISYLMTVTHARQQRLDNAVGADPGYGTHAYYRALDHGAPHVDAAAMRAGPIRPVPYIMRLYPIGYYALASVAIGIGDKLTDGSVVGEFFSARFLSVALVVPTLWFTWLALNELSLGKRRALLLLACTALLPLTAWMGGYIQPDNLVCALVAPIVYLGLRLRRMPEDAPSFVALGILLAALMATKQNYVPAVYIPIVAMLAVRMPARRSSLGWIAVLTLPMLASYAFTAPLLRAAPGGSGLCHIASALATAERGGPGEMMKYVALSFLSVFDGSFVRGADSFWLAYTAYRNSLLSFGTQSISQIVIVAIRVLSLLFFALFLLRLTNVARRLAAVGRRRSWRSAARVATSNVLVNAYLCYFIVMCGFELTVGGHIPVQGRYWLPFASAIWLIVVMLAPRALPRRVARPVGNALLVAILAFDAIASAFTFPSLHDRFYAPLPPIAASEELTANFDSIKRRNDAIEIRGWAMDDRNASPVDRIVVRLDDRTDIQTRTIASPDLQCETEDTLGNAGFEASFPRSSIAAGKHKLEIFVQTPWTGGLVDTGEKAPFTLR